MMTPEEYKAAKSAMYQKYKAGEITNYAYIQWKKKNDPALKTAGGPVSAPTAKSGTGAGSGSGAADPGQQATDDAVLKLEKELKKVYGAAAKEMKAALQEMVNDYGDEYNQKLQDVQAGKITQKQFDTWAENQVKTLETWQKKIDQCTGVMLNANQKAMAMVNGEQLHVFAENANWQSYALVQDAKLNLMFSIYDEHTVEKLIQDKPELLPRKEVNGKKDKAWNKTKIANAVTQSILQGDSIPNLAKRIAVQTGETNMNAMVRYARTAMTSAQNSGRMEMLHRAKGMGIKCKKTWLATLDARTRDVHAKLDGQTVDVDEPFHSDFGDIMFPGDMSSKGSVPGNLYNCRCTLTYEYEGYPSDPSENMRYDNETGQLITDMNYTEWKAAKQGSKLNDLNMAKLDLAEAQKAVIKAGVKEDKIYEGLWKDPVTLADYPAKKAGIQAKRDYYTAEIDKYTQAQAEGKSWATDDKIKELEKKRKLLNEFDIRGRLIEKRDAALKAVQDIYNQVGFAQTAAAPVYAKAKKTAKKAASASGGTSAGTAAKTAAGSAPAGKQGQFSPDAWDEKTKKAARSYSNRQAADKELRPELDADWDKLTDPEKYAVWEYTRNSNPMNKSLSGYHESWSRSNYRGPANTEWGHEDNYRTISTPDMKKFAKPDGHVGYKKAITDLTLAMEKTPLKKDTWLVRGSDENGLAGMMEGGGMNYNQVKSLFDGRHSLTDIKKAMVGQVGRNHAFTSTGIAKDAGFGGNIKYEIYAPAGTKCVYAEPQSYYGSTSSSSIYKKGKRYSSVGSEAEIIVQRGTAYRISDIRQRGSSYTVVMEIVEQPDYFVHGDEDTYNGGKTRHSR